MLMTINDSSVIATYTHTYEYELFLINRPLTQWFLYNGLVGDVNADICFIGLDLSVYITISQCIFFFIAVSSDSKNHILLETVTGRHRQWYDYHLDCRVCFYFRGDSLTECSR